MKRAVRIGVALSLGVFGCVPAAVPLEIDAGGVAVDDATLAVVVYADDGGGCDAQRFVATPKLPVLLSATAPFASLDIPRGGEKLVVVDAIDDAGVSIARGCIEVGSQVDNAARTVALARTLHLTNVDAATVVVAPTGSLGTSATVVDAAGEVVPQATVQARVFDSHGAAVGDAVVLTADDAGRVVFAPTTAPAGPVRIEFDVERPAAAAPTRLVGFAPPTVTAVAADVALRPFATNSGVSFAGVDAAGLVVVDVVAGVPAAPRVVLASPTARLAGVVDDGARRWVVVDGGIPALVGDVDGVAVAAAAPAIVDDASPLRLIAAGDCSGHALPAIVSSATEQTLLTLVDGALVTTLLPAAPRIVGSACVVGDDGTTHRLLVLGGDAVSVLDVGSGLLSTEALGGSAITAGLERSRALVARHDGALISVERDAAEVLLRALKLVAGAFVDAGAPVVRLPSAPLLVAHGAFGGDDDLAVLDGALFGVGNGPDGSIAAGLATSLCSPATCNAGIAVDVDNDGPVEVLVPQATGGAIVRFR